MPATGAAQDRVAATQAGTFNKEPTGIQLGTVLPGARVTTGPEQAGWRRVTLEGWIFSASTRPDTREGFDLSVKASPTENLRDSPNGTIVARLVEGALLERLDARGGWTRVRRTGWVPSATVPAPEAEATSAAPDPGSADPADRVVLPPGTILYATPGGDSTAAITGTPPVRVVSRAGEWVRIQIDAWARADSVQEAPSDAMVGVSAAEVRANPERYAGVTLDWDLQFVSIQTADELRPEIPLGREYLLTRGPAPEPGFVYVLVTPEQLQEFRAFQPLQDFTARVRVVAPKTKYLPNPVVRLLGLVRRGR